MICLLKLYPRAWRRRYGDELRSLVEAQPRSLGLAIDIIAGAIDARFNPHLAPPVTTASEREGGVVMVGKLLQLGCVGPKATTEDALKSAGIMLGGTAVLVFLWAWVERQVGSPYVNALMPLTFLVPLLVSLRYTSLKGRSAAVQATFIVGLTVVMTAMLLTSAWLRS